MKENEENSNNSGNQSETKTDDWVIQPKADTKAEVLPPNKVPTRECGWSPFNWGLEARKDDNKR